MAKILIVDDEPMIVDLIKIFAEEVSQGHDIFTAGSGKEAQKLIESHHFEVLVTDLKMPDLEGNDLIASIHEDFPDKKPLFTFIVSAFIDPDVAQSHDNLFFLIKPIDKDFFQTTLKKCLGDL